jgi:hypothetical protein
MLHYKLAESFTLVGAVLGSLQPQSYYKEKSYWL